MSPKEHCVHLDLKEDPAAQSTWDQVAQNEHGKVNDHPNNASRRATGSRWTYCTTSSGTLRSGRLNLAEVGHQEDGSFVGPSASDGSFFSQRKLEVHLPTPMAQRSGCLCPGLAATSATGSPGAPPIGHDWLVTPEARSPSGAGLPASEKAMFRAYWMASPCHGARGQMPIL